MKRYCDICTKEIGPFSMWAQLKDGTVCRECLLKAGLGNLLTKDGEHYTLEDVKKAQVARNYSKAFVFNSYESSKIRCIETALNSGNKTNKKNIDYAELERRANIFTETKSIKDYLSIDEKNELFKIIKPSFGLSPYIYGDPKTKAYYETNIISFSELLSYEVIENEETVLKGGYGMAAIGAVTFGAAGAVAGSILGKNAKGVCLSLNIKLTINGLADDIEYLYFINTKTKKNGYTYSTKLNVLNDCISALEIIVDSKRRSMDTDNQSSNDSIADEIKKYWDLCECGAITKEEFEKKKNELLRTSEIKEGDEQ